MRGEPCVDPLRKNCSFVGLSERLAHHLFELQVGEAPVDIVAKESTPASEPKTVRSADVIAVRVTGPLKIAVVGAPS